MHRADYTFSPNGLHLGLLLVLSPLLRNAGISRVQTMAHVIEFSADLPVQRDGFYSNMLSLFAGIEPLVGKTLQMSREEWRDLTQQALAEMYEEDFCGMWLLVTAWGIPQQRKNQKRIWEMERRKSLDNRVLKGTTHTTSPMNRVQGEQKQEQRSAPYYDILLLCHPQNIGPLVHTLEEQMKHAQGEIPASVAWSGTSVLLHQGIIVIEWAGKASPQAFVDNLCLDTEIFDLIVYPYEWLLDPMPAREGAKG